MAGGGQEIGDEPFFIYKNILDQPESQNILTTQNAVHKFVQHLVSGSFNHYKVDRGI